VKIESYLVNPLPQDRLQVRIFDRSGAIPIKGVRLFQGERVLLFLSKEEDHFVIEGGLIGAKFVIEGDQVIYRLMGNSPPQPLTEVISRIKTVASAWAGEKLTDEHRSQVINLAVGEPGIKDFLAGRDFKINQVIPSVREDALAEIFYTVPIEVLNMDRIDVELAVRVNATRKKVENIQVNAYTAYSDAEQNEIRQIALANPVVKGMIGGSAYKIGSIIIKDSWQDNVQGKIEINVFPKIEILLQPTISNILNVFVDPEAGKVVKIINESYISPEPLESSASRQDFNLSVKIPKTRYRVGETAVASLTLLYIGTGPVELSSPGGQYFDLIIRDDQNNIVYQWERYEAGLPASLPAPAEITAPPPPLTAIPENPVQETIGPGQSITANLEFSIPKAGTYYLSGRNYGGWGFGQILASYPGGGGYGLSLESPFVVIDVY
jgi:hypothetical protein